MAMALQSSQPNQIQQRFFSKDTIGLFNNELLNKVGTNLDRTQKEQVVNILIKNMKNVFKRIDLSRINQTNFNGIFGQFKNHSLQMALDEVNTSGVIDNRSQQVNMKFDRDCNSIPSGALRVPERPIATSFQDNFQTNVPSLGQAKADEVKSKLAQLEMDRQNEFRQPQRPPTPDFLKPMKFGSRTDDRQSNQTNQPRQDNKRQHERNIQDANPTDDNNFSSGLVNDLGADLFSIDNIDAPLMDIENFKEDTSGFEDRLKRLESERSNIGQIPQNTVDFTSQNFPKDAGNIVKRQDEDESRRLHQLQPVQQQPRQPVQQPTQQQLLRQPVQPVQQQPSRQPIQQPRQPIQQPSRQPIQQPRQPIQQPIEQSFDLFPSPKQIPSPNRENQLEKIKSMIDKLKASNEELMKRNRELEQENEKYQKVKTQLASEYEKLTIKETEINKKQLELNQSIATYGHLFKSNTLQVDIEEKETSYRWDLGDNYKVSGLKLVNYSLPNIRYNIDTHNNYLMINNNKMVIDSGNYNIEQLLNEINIKQSNFRLLLKPSCKIEIELLEEAKENNINITKSQLLNNVLGFSENIKLNENNKNVIGTNVYDLRIDNKIYMYITNLSDNPFGILYSNSQVPCQFSFKEPFNLNCLDICFRNSFGDIINFHNLTHNLGFILLTHNS